MAQMALHCWGLRWGIWTGTLVCALPTLGGTHVCAGPPQCVSPHIIGQIAGVVPNWMLTVKYFGISGAKVERAKVERTNVEMLEAM